MLPGEIAHFRPESVEEAVELASAWGKEGAYLAGGTDLVLEMKRGERQHKALIEVARLPEMNVLKAAEGCLVIGAAVPFGVIASSADVAAHAPALAQAAMEVGSPQIRTVATLGGNIATGSAAGDSLPALSAYGAVIVTAGPRGERESDLDTCLQARNGELIREVRIPIAEGAQSGAFVKLGRRNALAVSRISAALVLSWAGQGRVGDARLVLGAVGKAPLRVVEAERVLAGSGLDASVRQEVARLASETVAASIPGRASAPYKKRAVIGVVLAAFEKLTRG